MEEIKKDAMKLNDDDDFFFFMDKEEDERLLDETMKSVARTEGQEEERSNIIKRMLKCNMSYEEISNIVNIPIEDVKKYEN